MDKLDGDSLGTAITDFAHHELMILSDTSDSGNLVKLTTSNFEDAIFGNISGDATVAAGGALTIAATSVENSMLAGSIANAKLSNSTITVSDGSNTTATALGGTITFAATANETTVAESSGTVTIGLPNDVTIGGDLTVTGNDSKSSTGATAITLSGDDVAIADNLTVPATGVLYVGDSTISDASANLQIGGTSSIQYTAKGQYGAHTFYTQDGAGADTSYSSANTGDNLVSTSTGGGGGHTHGSTPTLQPSVTVYIWKRTA